jgi:threonine dehydrogenase-like Zn-dependent dehydrogenase
MLLTVADIVEHRLGIARDLGADYTYLSKVGQDEQETVNTVHSLLDGPPDVTIDCSGAEANIRLAILVRTALCCSYVVCFPHCIPQICRIWGSHYSN